MPKSEKQKTYVFFWNGEFYIVAKFKVIGVKMKKDERRSAFLMSHMPTVSGRPGTNPAGGQSET